MSIDQRLEIIFREWFDYEHAGDEDAKYNHKLKRAELIVEAMKTMKTTASVGDFLHCYRDDYRTWIVRMKLGAPRRRF